MKKSCILEILTPIKSTSKCLRIDVKIRTKKIKKYVFCSEIIQIINKIADL